ncbi:NAD(P)-binding protein [Nadsonia fulvescens var. elongata DSM 6958]|uniref:NAD(P)-binding protein n=1 Tax=Nadsonia fulvescens var. elongata DSM 6958 TaxID=857566 RepID=A0A1E3PTC7_9ASCO|nr:NAD(P)-binding protein [Nadsonia fulvescens var. elongata DSM 6958]
MWPTHPAMQTAMCTVQLGKIWGGTAVTEPGLGLELNRCQRACCMTHVKVHRGPSGFWLRAQTPRDCLRIGATVYGDATRFPDMILIPEYCPTGPTNPYGMTKITIENIIRDLFSSDNSWKSAILRCYNPIGAHPSGLVGEDPLGIPNNLLPFLAQVAIGRQEKMYIFGDDCDSRDGTPIRDYIHVVDLAKDHIAALNYLNESQQGLCREWNLGTGNGSTVIEVFNAFCKAIGRDLPFEITGRRDGNVLNLTADARRANKKLKWLTELPTDDTCGDLWKWTADNPMGYFNNESHFEDRLYTLISSDGRFEFSVSNLGASVVDASLGGVKLCYSFDNEEGYLRKDNPFFSATGGKLTVKGSTYQLPLNENSVNTIHGGSSEFDKRLFLGSIEGENNFPGDLVVKVIYSLQKVEKGGANGLEYEAKLSPNTNIPETAVFITNHSYWNIGNNSTIESTVAFITDKNLQIATIETGKSTILGQKSPQFYYCFTVTDPKKISNRPQIQDHANHINVEGLFGKRASFCLEAARFIDSCIVLKKGEVYGSSTL